MQRGEVIRKKLSEMNPFAQIEFADKATVESELASADAAKLSAVVYGIASWGEAVKINELTRQLRRLNGSSPAFYCVNSSGLFGFCFADLGPMLSFGQKSRDVDNKAIET